MDNECFTIGHSTHTKEEMINLLKQNKINYLLDVRSIPYSKYASQYNKKDNHIHYKYLGNMLGGAVVRFNSHNSESTVLTDIRNGEQFQKGISIVVNFLKKNKNIALMCSEKDPFTCHRFFLISFSLTRLGFKVNHIFSENELIKNSTLEKKIRKKFNQRTLTDFNQGRVDIEKCYEKHALQVYKKL